MSESSSHNHHHRVQDEHRVPLGDLIRKKELDTQSIEEAVVEPKSTEGRKLIQRRKLTQNPPSEVDAKTLSHSRPKESSSPSRQEGNVVTKSTQRGVAVTKSTEGRHTVDRKGCRHQVDKKGMSSPSRQEVITQLTEGVAVTKSTRGGCRHQADKRSLHS